MPLAFIISTLELQQQQQRQPAPLFSMQAQLQQQTCYVHLDKPPALLGWHDTHPNDMTGNWKLGGPGGAHAFASA
eukprot:CAMPEP_0202915980 /NCGR_PEP_ID=MMETSP1392-20130828/67262_1 /ASSEMBLY_ACC=CAM_ASM_000868 /TAXON_ID=225041 /ORGANISM="Chlamydomonas chlamydogama, Strain SAG 11-48b" /LENGTH=74 /DNA_ID=CAMNT_0049608205 /DNA_START=100 /DNA_END=324 /DNA_ORIENTATION=-